MCKRMLLALGIATLLGLVSTASWSEQAGPALGGEVRSQGVVFRVPPSMARVEERHEAALSQVLFGLKDSCDKYFERFLGVFWSPHELTLEQIIPSPDYKILPPAPDNSSQEATKKASHGRLLRITSVNLSLTKRCGVIEKPRLIVVRFRANSVGPYFAVAGFLEPFLGEAVLVAVAQSISELTGTSSKV